MIKLLILAIFLVSAVMVFIGLFAGIWYGDQSGPGIAALGYVCFAMSCLVFNAGGDYFIFLIFASGIFSLVLSRLYKRRLKLQAKEQEL